MYLTLIHFGGGSTAEASNAVSVLGPFNSVDEANKAGTEFYDAVKHHGYFYDEVWSTLVEIPNAAVNVKEAADTFIQAYG